MRSRALLIGLVILTLLLSGCDDDGVSEATQPTNMPPTTTTAAPTTVAPTTTTVEESGAAAVASDLEFATYDGVPLTLDLYFPAEPAGAPVLVTEGFEEIERLVGEGVTVVNVDDFGPPIPPVGPDQPLSDNRVAFRDTAEAFACAIRFARERASKLGSDDPTVALMSLSVGGGFVAHVALFGAELEAAWEEFAATGGPPRKIDCVAASGSTDVDGMIGVAGAYDFLVPVFEGLYGLTYQQERDPELQEFMASAVGRNPHLKVRLFHDPADPAIPLENSTMFEAVLAEAGYDVAVIEFDGGHSYPQAELVVPVLMEVLDR